MVYDPAHVARWEPYNLYDNGHVSFVGSVLDPAKHNTKAGWDLIYYLDRDLSDVCNS